MNPSFPLPAATIGDDDVSARVYTASRSDGPLRQGEVLTDLEIKKLDVGSIQAGTEDLLVAVTYPYVIVASQDCDLDQDYRIRCNESGTLPTLPCVLLYEMFTAANLKSGRSDLNQGSLPWTNARQNKTERYHFLEAVPADRDAVGEGLPELALDFKRYLTVPTDELYARITRGILRRRCRLSSPFLEHWSFRHAAFQCRVALPRPHASK